MFLKSSKKDGKSKKKLYTFINEHKCGSSGQYSLSHTRERERERERENQLPTKRL